WYDGGFLPPTPPGFPATMKMSAEGGVLFVGSHGMLMHDTYGENPQLIGEGLSEKAKKIPVSLPRIAGGMGAHEMNWVRAIRGEGCALPSRRQARGHRAVDAGPAGGDTGAGRRAGRGAALGCHRAVRRQEPERVGDD